IDSSVDGDFAGNQVDITPDQCPKLGGANTAGRRKHDLELEVLAHRFEDGSHILFARRDHLFGSFVAAPRNGNSLHWIDGDPVLLAHALNRARKATEDAPGGDNADPSIPEVIPELGHNPARQLSEPHPADALLKLDGAIW